MARSSGARLPCPSSPLLLSGGGTGGHVYPALAVAEALRAAASPVLCYVGRGDSIEERIVGRESDLPFRALPAAALRGRGPLGALRGLATTISGVQAARRLLAELRPAAILGTGGYVCVPLFLAARSMWVPTMIYLPDVVPGLAIRLLALVATRVACAVEDSARYLRRQTPLLVTGYPVRAALFNQDAAACRGAFGLSEALPVVLVYGGSLGARSINRAIAALLPALLARCQVIHICGREGDASWLAAAAEQLPQALRERYRLFPYLEAGAGAAGMAAAFGAAAVAICRSGASTMAELPAAGLPAILVPYPYVHQDENADYLVERGAALKVADGALLGAGEPHNGALFVALTRLLDDPRARQRMAECSRSLARPDAAHALAAALLGLATRSLS